MKENKSQNDGILVVGSANMDMVVKTNHFPKPGETVLGDEFGMYPGGKGANQAVCAAKLGAPTYFLGKMGNDLFAKKLSDAMKKDGVLLDYLMIDENNPTGVALITIDKAGQNEIVVASGSNMSFDPADLEKRKEVFSKVGIVLVQLEIPIETVYTAAEYAKKIHAHFILNPAPAKKLSDSLYPFVDTITPNEIELEILTGITINGFRSVCIASKKLLDKGVTNVIVTLGEMGAYLVNRDGEKHFPVNKVVAVDTTAAGDAFNGAYAYAIYQGEEIDHAIQFANRVASLSVTKIGAQSSMPTMDSVESFLI